MGKVIPFRRAEPLLAQQADTQHGLPSPETAEEVEVMGLIAVFAAIGCQAQEALTRLRATYAQMVGLRPPPDPEKQADSSSQHLRP